MDKNGFINTGLGLGSEEIVNGDFDTDSDWVKGTGWTIANGVAINQGNNGSQQILQTGVVSSNKSYEVTITVVSNEGTGNNTIYIGDKIVSNTNLGVGTYTFQATPTSGSTINIFCSSGGEFSIDNVSVREITEVNTDVPRLDYTGGGCPSLLLEPTSTNITQYSEDFTQSYWTKEDNPTIESDVEISPTGSLNGSYLKANVGTNISPRVVQTFGCAASQTYTGSVFVKKDNVDYIRLLSTGATASTLNAYYNVSNGTLGASGSPDKAKIEDYGNGWYRLSLVINTTQNTGGATFRVQLAKGDGVPTSTYDGTEKNIIFGAQLEQQTYATSYIPTFGTASTRAADVGNSTGDLSNVINSSEGVLYAEISGLSDTININEAISIQSASALNRLYIYRSGVENKYGFAVFSDGNLQCNIKSGLVDFSENVKISAKYKANDFALWVNGSQVDTDNNGNTPIGLSEVSLDGGNSSDEFYGKVKEIRVYDEALSDSELQALTTL